MCWLHHWLFLKENLFQAIKKYGGNTTRSPQFSSLQNWTFESIKNHHFWLYSKKENISNHHGGIFSVVKPTDCQECKFWTPSGHQVSFTSQGVPAGWSRGLEGCPWAEGGGLYLGWAKNLFSALKHPWNIWAKTPWFLEKRSWWRMVVFSDDIFSRLIMDPFLPSLKLIPTFAHTPPAHALTQSKTGTHKNNDAKHLLKKRVYCSPSGRGFRLVLQRQAKDGLRVGNLHFFLDQNFPRKTKI